ncbi:MAG: hypothetical protein KAY32_07540, partial [Candidatus Eisenbacteria sp.]|nr:hypothetical protein [Candidatus Eisenbacteria bacterium]
VPTAITTPTGLTSGGSQAITYSVDIPAGQVEGVYTGTVTVTSPGEDAAGDVFDVSLTVGAVESITMTDPLDFNTNHGLVGSTNFTVTNTGNNTLDNLIFTSTDFVFGTHIIPASNVTFDPTEISTLGPLATSGAITINVFVPLGTFTGAYTATITTKDDDGYPLVTQDVILTVNPLYDLDIADNQQNLVGNKMSLAGAVSTTVSGEFLLINPNTGDLNVDPDDFGNANLTNLTYTLTDLTGPGANIVPTAITTPAGLTSGGSQAITYSVDIPAGQVEGVYTGTVTVTSPGEDAAGDVFDVSLAVGAAESIVLTNIYPVDSVGHGEIASDWFTVKNTGNADLDNIVFNISAPVDIFTAFYPASISQLLVGETDTVKVTGLVPLGTLTGLYTATVTVKDDDGYPLETVSVSAFVDPSYDLDIADNQQNVVGNKMSLAGKVDTTVSAKFLLVNPNSEAMNVDLEDAFGNADLANLTYTLTDLTGPGANIVPTAITTPTGLTSGGSEAITYSVVIPAGQVEGVYTGTVTVTSPGEDDTGDSFDVVLVVAPVGEITVTTPANIATDHGTTGSSSFSVTNTGNSILTDIVFEMTDLDDGAGHRIAKENIYFNPTSISILGIGAIENVDVYVYVPAGTYANTYTGTIRVKDDDNYPSATVTLTVIVNPAYDLDIANDDRFGGNVNQNILEYKGKVGEPLSGKSFIVINPNSPTLNVDDDPFGNADLTALSDTVYELTVSAAKDLVFKATVNVVFDTTFLASGHWMKVGVTVDTIPRDQQVGTYEGIIEVMDDITGVSDQFVIKVIVEASEIVNIVKDTLETDVDAGAIAILPFNVKNDGSNVTLYNLDLIPLGDLMSVTGGRIPRENIKFTKPVIDSLAIDA